MLEAHKKIIELLGKTLNLTVLPLQRETPAPILMSSLMTHLTHFFTPSAAVPPASPAAALMESADLCAGVDARHAQELRAAASAWLRVVR